MWFSVWPQASATLPQQYDVWAQATRPSLLELDKPNTALSNLHVCNAESGVAHQSTLRRPNWEDRPLAAPSRGPSASSISNAMTGASAGINESWLRLFGKAGLLDCSTSTEER